jgi:peptidyl-prolyl cis-trans isomerase C
MMFIKSRILLVSAVSLLTLSACHSKEKESAGASAKPTNDAVVATVNGSPITTSQVDVMVRQSTAQGQPDSTDLRNKIIENLAVQTLLAQEAVKKGLDKKPETQSQLELVKKSVIANAFVQDYVKNNPVTDEMAKAEYEKIKKQRSGNEYKARHILVAKESDAKDIIAKLKKDPKQFAALANQYSIDPGSKSNGGDLGWFDPHKMVPEFGAALAKLGKGQITQEPVKSQFGYHVIMLEDSRPVQIPSFDEIKDQMKRQMQQQNLQRLLDEMKSKAKIEIVSQPPSAAASAPAQSSAQPAQSTPQAAPAKK